MADGANSLPGEIWKDVPGCPGYEVSNLAGVRTKPRILRAWDHKNTYQYIGTGGKRWALHRLVCEAFHGPPPLDGMVAAHGDGDPANNNADNLRWATYAENNRDAQRHGTAFDIAGYVAKLPPEGKPNRRLTKADYREVSRLRDAGGPRRDEATKVGVSEAHVSRICSGSRRRYGN